MATIRALLFSSALALAASASATPVDPALYSQLQWRLLGPFRAGWAEMIQGVPDKPNTYLFGASGGGIWRTDDAGQTWTSLFDRGGSSAIGAIAIAPSNPNVIYAGGGHPSRAMTCRRAVGIYKSTDGGAHLDQPRARRYALRRPHLGQSHRSEHRPRRRRRPLLRCKRGTRNLPFDRRRQDLEENAVRRQPDWRRRSRRRPAHPNIVFASPGTARNWPWLSYFTPIEGEGSAIYNSLDGGATWQTSGRRNWPKGKLGRIGLAATRKAASSALRRHRFRRPTAACGAPMTAAPTGAVNAEKAYASYYFNRVTVDPKNPDVVYLTGQSMRRCDQAGALA